MESEEKRGPGRPPKQKLDMEQLIQALAASTQMSAEAAVQSAEAQQRMLMKTSRKPLEVTSKATPETHDIRASAHELYREKGHTPSVWNVAVAGVDLFWDCKCVTCGASGEARWHSGLQNAPDAEIWVPVIGGDMASKTEKQMLNPKARLRGKSYHAAPDIRNQAG